MEATHIIEGVVLPPLVFTPNFAHTSYVSGGIVPLSAVFLTLSTLSLALRFYIRVKLLRAFFAEDCELGTICYEAPQLKSYRRYHRCLGVHHHFDRNLLG